jgi:hypothetical protein
MSFRKLLKKAGKTAQQDLQGLWRGVPSEQSRKRARQSRSAKAARRRVARAAATKKRTAQRESRRESAAKRKLEAEAKRQEKRTKELTITVKDHGAIAMLSRLLEGGALKVGVLAEDAAEQHEDEDGEPSGLTVGEIAEIHEFGLGSVPRRSFLAGWADEEADKIKTVITRGGQALARGKLSSIDQLLEQIGTWAVGSIQARMATSIPPPNAPLTIKRKGSSVTLIDTGQLRASISYEGGREREGGRRCDPLECDGSPISSPRFRVSRSRRLTRCTRRTSRACSVTARARTCTRSCSSSWSCRSAQALTS